MDGYFRPGNPLSEDQKKWCRCTLHVAARQSPSCLQNPVRRKGCYNPYAVCSSSVKTSVPGGCGEWFDFEQIPFEELLAYAYLRKIPLPSNPTRDDVLEAIADWKRGERPLR